MVATFRGTRRRRAGQPVNRQCRTRTALAHVVRAELLVVSTRVLGPILKRLARCRQRLKVALCALAAALLGYCVRTAVLYVDALRLVQGERKPLFARARLSKLARVWYLRPSATAVDALVSRQVCCVSFLAHTASVLDYATSVRAHRLAQTGQACQTNDIVSGTHALPIFQFRVASAALEIDRDAPLVREVHNVFFRTDAAATFVNAAQLLTSRGFNTSTRVQRSYIASNACANSARRPLVLAASRGTALSVQLEHLA